MNLKKYRVYKDKVSQNSRTQLEDNHQVPVPFSFVYPTVPTLLLVTLALVASQQICV